METKHCPRPTTGPEEHLILIWVKPPKRPGLWAEQNVSQQPGTALRISWRAVDTQGMGSARRV